MNIHFINKSTVIHDDEVQSWMTPFQSYVKHVHYWWPRDVRVVYTDPSAEPDLAWKVIIADTSDEAGALGYHDFTPDGRPISYVFAKDDIDNGYSPTVTATHELAEMIADPWISQVFQIADDQFFAQEICDPCEKDNQGYMIGNIQVSDFVTPRWFIPGSSSNYVFDHCRLIQEPLEILPGGYMSLYQPDIGWTQIYADKQTRRYGRVSDAKKDKGKYSRLTKYGRQRHSQLYVD